MESHARPGIKRTLEVRLSRRLSADELRELALQLKAMDPRDYPRTFIAYYLPGMSVGTGAWATSHFSPDLKVEILGLNQAQASDLSNDLDATNQQLIGRWLLDTPGLAGRVSIFRENGRAFLEWSFRAGGSQRMEVVETMSPLGRRFDAVRRSSGSDHWIVTEDGNLELRDNDGLTATAVKIE